MFIVAAILWLLLVALVKFSAGRFVGGFISMLMLALVWASASMAMGSWGSIAAAIYLFALFLACCVNAARNQDIANVAITMGAISAFLGSGLLLSL